MKKEFWEFVRQHLHDDPARLRLKYAKDSDLDFPLAITQIEARKKGAAKFRRLLSEKPEFLFPSVLAAEQATNEDVSLLHGSMVAKGENLLDMTGGLGMDDYAMAKAGATVTAVERNPDTSEALRQNFPEIEVVNADSLSYLESKPRIFDTIFVDPARRSDTGARTYGFKDCSPDILANMDLILKHCKRLIIKASPMLDPKQVLREIPEISELAAVSFKGECKELLITVIPGKETVPTKFTAINILPDGSRQSFDMTSSGTPLYADAPVEYLYEPNASVMKFNDLSPLFNVYPDLRQASPNTMLLFSDTLYADFPGRVLKVIREVAPKEKSLAGTPLNIVCRNYPLKTEEIRKRLKTKDAPDADRFLYALRLAGKPTILLCESVHC